MARATTSPELALLRSDNQFANVRAAIYPPHTIYTARVNQSFASLDQVLELIYNSGSGTLANVLPDMTVLVGSSAGAWDKGLARLRDKDASKFYIGETSDIRFANGDHLTIVDDFGLWARPNLIVNAVEYMDGGIAYSDQHVKFDPTPVMGSDRVLKKTGSTVSASFPEGANSYCIGSSIAAYAWSCATASASSGTTTATPTFTFNTLGWHLVYLTLTAANGKSFFGVRRVFVYDADHLPPGVVAGSCQGSADSGGWQFEITLYDHADLTTVRDRSLVILFEEGYYGSTAQSIGPLSGAENIIAIGWIGGESIQWNPDYGAVKFTAYSAQAWMQKIPGWPGGVKFVGGTPANWTEVQGLTVDRGIIGHYLRWRTTATRVMDCFPTGDTRYSKEVSSLAGNLWDQLKEMSFRQILTRPGVDRYNRLFLEVHPQLVPLADRSWPTVMTVTKKDWMGEINFERIVTPPVALVNSSGVAVNASGSASALFSLSPGHSYSHYGKIEMVDRLLLASQAQANSLCGLYYGWKNNPYPDIPISLAMNNRMIDCFPRQKCAIQIDPSDTPRGLSYNGNLLPTAVTFNIQDGYIQTDVTFEAETFEAPSINGDIPGGRADTSTPPTPSFPPLPDFPPILPGTIEPTASGPQTVVLHDPVGGFILLDLSGATPRYSQINAGLTSGQYTGANLMFVTPGGVMYVARATGNPSDGNFIARAPSVGGTFTVIYTPTNGVWAMGYNPLVSDYVCVIMDTGTGRKLHAGSGGSLSVGAAVGAVIGSSGAHPIALTYGLGKWLTQTFDHWETYGSTGLTVVGSGTIGTGPATWHVRASTTGRTFHDRNGTPGYLIGENNLATNTLYSDSTSQNMRSFDCDPTGTYCMWRKESGNRWKSSDGGASWALMTTLILQNWNYAYAGPGTTAARFMAAAADVYYTPDFGATWQLLTTTELWGITPFPAIDMLQVIEY